MKICIVAALSLCLSACGSTATLAPKASDRQAKAFAPPGGQATVYVFRETRLKNSLLNFYVSINGTPLGNIGNKTYFMLVLDPGENDLWFGWDPELPPAAMFRLNRLKINAVAGQTYFVRVSRWDKPPEILEPAPGRKKLQSCCVLAEPTRDAETLVN
jgi:hypothetical protein